MPRELNIQKIRSMDLDEVQTRIRSLEEELFNLRFRNAMRQLDNPVEIRNIRRDLARLKTAIREHESGRNTLGAEGVANG
jgi:large subunit ribosomal protein L29